MASGMSACLTIMSLLEVGDHVLCVDDVYGGTQRYLRKILRDRQGVQVDLIDFSDPAKFKAAFTPKTKIVWLETPTNPTLKVFDIAAVAKATKEMGALLVVDNTFFTPFLQNPLDLGADMVVHSITKYIGGHSDVVMGCICLNDAELYDRLYFVMKSIGTGAPAFESYLALRGSKTLAVRMERAEKSAREIAEFLEKHAKVSKVIYPGLKSHPNHELVKKQARGFGAMISFYIKGGINEADKFLKALKIFTLAESLGGAESLIENPALMTHMSVPAEDRKALGIEDNFIRVSVGIEDLKDLMDDLKRGFAAI